MLRKKLAMRPVISTASGGRTAPKKYRNAFTSSLSFFSAFLIRFLFAARNLRSPDSTTDRGRDRATAFQDRHRLRRRRSPCICRSAHFALPASRGGALRRGPRFLEDQAPLLSVSRSRLPSSLVILTGLCPQQVQIGRFDRLRKGVA